MLLGLFVNSLAFMTLGPFYPTLVVHESLFNFWYLLSLGTILVLCFPVSFGILVQFMYFWAGGACVCSIKIVGLIVKKHNVFVQLSTR